ncbi:hypothetical protein [Massilia brevitalea]|uniref:hypothetical protein n=1 Tax=Massilia brevitalea TaxID=442526 RepID=UPI002738E469|nr:hypothetical protein [Massilia brevitalea]
MHFGDRHPAARPNWTPLALTLGVHLLLVLAWRWQAQTLPLPVLPERLTELLPLRPMPAPSVSVPPTAPPPSASTSPPKPLPAPRKTVSTPPLASAPPAPADTAPAAQPDTAELPQPAEQPAGDAPVTLAGEDLLAAGKRSAAAFDREQRKGKSGVPLEADTPWSRFRAGLAAAHIDRSLSMRLEKYESPDGVVIYRTTQGGKQTCRMTGSVVFGPGAAGGGSAAGNVTCPKGVSWERI